MSAGADERLEEDGMFLLTANADLPRLGPRLNERLYEPMA